MSHISSEARAQAAETKKRRTREKLIRAADVLMRDEGFSTTVEAIAEEAAVSVPNFYNYYRSRNLLCLDAFTELVIGPLEELGIAERPFEESVDALLKLCAERSALVRAALVGRLEDVPDKLVVYSKDAFIERVAALLASHWGLGHYHGPDIMSGKQAAHQTVARMSALFILDQIATNRSPELGNLYELMETTLPDKS